MDAKLHKAISELDEYIALCRKRLDAVLSGLNWTENVTLQDIGAGMLEREDSEDEDDPPLPQSFGCENSVVIGVDQLKAIINADTASIAKKFSDIQLNYTREQKREIYDYVIYNTKKLSEPEVKVTVSNNYEPSSNMTIAQIVAKAKANAKIQRRKYSTSKPTHIEEVREMLHLQMQALNQLYKPKPVQPHTNTSRQPHLDMLSPFIAPRSGDSYSRSESCERRSVFRRPSLDMVIRVRPPSSERACRSKSRDCSVDMLHRMSQTNDEPAVRGAPLRIKANQSKERSLSGSSCKDRTKKMSDSASQGNDEPKNKTNPFRAKADTSSGRSTQIKDRGSQCRDKSSESNVYRSTETLNRSSDRRGQNGDKISRSKSLQPKPERGGLQSDESRGRGNQCQSGGQGQSWNRCRNPSSSCTSGMHQECGRRDLNECRRDLSRQDKRSLKQRRDGRYQREENSTEKEKVVSSERRKDRSREKKSRRDKSSRDRGERHQRRDRVRGDKRKSRDKRHPSSSGSRSISSSSSSKCKSKGKRSQVDIKRSKSKETQQSHRGSEKSANRSSRSRNRRSQSRATVENAQQTQNNTKCRRSFRSPSKPPQHQASPKKSKSHSKSRAQDEKQQMRKRSSDTRPSSRASQETSAKRLKDSPTTTPTSKDIYQMLKRLQDISKKVAPKTVQVKADPDRI